MSNIQKHSRYGCCRRKKWGRAKGREWLEGFVQGSSLVRGLPETGKEGTIVANWRCV